MRIILISMTLFFSTYVSADPLGNYSQILKDGKYTIDDINPPLKMKKHIDTKYKESNCSAFSKFAESSFNARQRGVKAETMFSTISQEEDNVKKIMQLIITDTFRFPVVNNEKDAEQMAMEYANGYFLDCMML